MPRVMIDLDVHAGMTITLNRIACRHEGEEVEHRLVHLIVEAALPVIPAPLAHPFARRHGNLVGGRAHGGFKVYPVGVVAEDRKSTRLNSSHVAISYAVFCLK